MTLSAEDRAEIIDLMRRELAGRDPSPTCAAADGADESDAASSREGWVLVLLHSLTASVALGALTCSMLFDLASHAAPEPYTYPRSAYWLVVVGLLVGFLSAATGIPAHRRIPVGSQEERQSGRHMGMALCGTAGYVVAFVWRRGTDFLGEVPLPIVGISALSLLLIWSAMVSGLQISHRIVRGRVPSTVGDSTDP